MSKKSILLRKLRWDDEARSLEEVEAVVELHESGLSLSEIGALFSGEPMSKEGVRKIIKRAGRSNGERRTRMPRLEPIVDTVHLIMSDDTITSFHILRERTHRNIDALIRYLHKVRLFHKVISLFDKRRKDAKRTRDTASVDMTVRMLQSLAIELGHNPSMTEINELDPVLYGRIGYSHGVNFFRRLASLPQESGAPLDQKFVSMFKSRRVG